MLAYKDKRNVDKDLLMILALDEVELFLDSLTSLRNVPNLQWTSWRPLQK